MEATILDLRKNMKKVMSAIERNERVILTRRSRRMAVIMPVREQDAEKKNALGDIQAAEVISGEEEDYMVGSEAHDVLLEPGHHVAGDVSCHDPVDDADVEHGTQMGKDRAFGSVRTLVDHGRSDGGGIAYRHDDRGLPLVSCHRCQEHRC